MQRNTCEERYSKAFQAIQDAVKAWESLDGPLVNGRKALTEDLVQAIEQGINATADLGPTGELKVIAEDSYEVALLFDALADNYREYKRKACAAISLSEIDVDGDATLWRAIQSLQEWFAAKYNYQPPPGVDVLRMQGVGDEQIARIYGWADEDGEPDFGKVLEEELEPGTHYDQKTWVHPAKRRRIEVARVAIAARTPRRKEYEIEKEFGKTAPPSLDELVRLGAPAAQIAALHGIEIEDAEALLRSRDAKTDESDAERLQRDTESGAAKPKKTKAPA